ncbi:MAG: porin family protein [Nitrospirae bacterium]|nr:MAG: porin family protein [Nitrospirota bacterium]
MLFLLGSVGILSQSVRAELYVGAQVGGNFPSDFSDVNGVGARSGVTLSDLDLDNSVVFGGKVGYFFPSIPWLGIESEVYTATPDLPSQTATASASVTVFGTTITGSGSITLPSADVRVTTWANLIQVRYPGSAIQPYAGVGLGVFFADIDGTGFSDSDTAPGLVVNTGLRWYVTKRIAVFGEYKYNFVSLEFDDPTVSVEGDYSAHNVVGGISFHFPGL